MSDIYANAVDSLRIAIEHFLKEADYSSRKHAILTLFHAIELFLKEQLHRTNPILIYRNLDTKISDDSLTVGIKESLARLDNLGIGLPKHQQEIIEKIQKRRNRIEHHRYDHRQEDDAVIADSLAFIMFFVEDVLMGKLEEGIPPAMLREIQRIVYERNERYAIAEYRLHVWMHEKWPDWSDEEADSPDEFAGTLDCPICREDFFLIDDHDKPFCYYCNTSIDGGMCKNCGRTYLTKTGCCSEE